MLWIEIGFRMRLLRCFQYWCGPERFWMLDKQLTQSLVVSGLLMNEYECFFSIGVGTSVCVCQLKFAEGCKFFLLALFCVPRGKSKIYTGNK